MQSKKNNANLLFWSIFNPIIYFPSLSAHLNTQHQHPLHGCSCVLPKILDDSHGEKLLFLYIWHHPAKWDHFLFHILLLVGLLKLFRSPVPCTQLGHWWAPSHRHRLFPTVGCAALQFSQSNDLYHSPIWHYWDLKWLESALLSHFSQQPEWKLGRINIGVWTYIWLHVSHCHKVPCLIVICEWSRIKPWFILT